MRASTLHTLPRVAFIGMLFLVFGTADSLFQSVPTGQIAFTSKAHGNMDIYIMRIGVGDPQQLISNTSDDYWSSWSPDGRRLAFASNRRGNFDVYAIDVPDDPEYSGDEGALAIQPLTTNLADDLEPAWSPDGRQLAFMSIRGGNVDVYLLDLESGTESQLTDHPAADWLPAWSPDGNRVLFVSDRDGDAEIFLMDPDGTNQRPLTSNEVTDEYPAWSPDGKQISFACGYGEGRELCLMDADGANVRVLTNDRASVWVQTWSPDGKWIVFTSDRDGNRELYRLRLEDFLLVRLTDNGYLDGIAAWRPATHGRD
jgi:Tol biopolymer transport system component